MKESEQIAKRLPLKESVVPGSGVEPERPRTAAFEATASTHFANRAFCCANHSRKLIRTLWGGRSASNRHLRESHSRARPIELRPPSNMVGIEGFEPSASCTPCKRAIQAALYPERIFENGQGERARTSDPCIPNALRYQLRYTLTKPLRIIEWSVWRDSNSRYSCSRSRRIDQAFPHTVELVGVIGIGPMTYRLSSDCSTTELHT